MLNRYLSISILGVFLEGFVLGTSSVGSNQPSNYPNVAPGMSEETYDTFPPNEASGREEIAYIDERDQNILDRANRKGNWNFKQNWRYDREAFYRGENQSNVYDREHPDGIGGIGRDPDPEYLQMRNFYLEELNRNQQAAYHNQRANDKRQSGNNDR